MSSRTLIRDLQHDGDHITDKDSESSLTAQAGSGRRCALLLILLHDGIESFADTVQPSPDIGFAHLDNLGDIRTSTFGGKKEMKAEELSSLYSSINDAGKETGPQTDGENKTKEPTPLERASEARRKAEEAARFAEEKVNALETANTRRHHKRKGPIGTPQKRDGQVANR